MLAIIAINDPFIFLNTNLKNEINLRIIFLLNLTFFVIVLFSEDKKEKI